MMASKKQRLDLKEVEAVEAGSNEQESNNSNVLLKPEPLSVAVDGDLLNKIVSGFQNQLTEVLNRLTALQNPQNSQNELVSTGIKPENAQNAVMRKRGRKHTTTLVGETTFSFEPPQFCKEENIDLDKVLICRFKDEIDGKNISELSATERLQNWKVERRARRSTRVQDIYYYHLPSQLKLRSRPLVYQFLLDGTYRPNHAQGTKKAKKMVEAEAVDNERSSSASGESIRRSKRSSQKTISDVPEFKMKKNKTEVNDAGKKIETEERVNKKNNDNIENKMVSEEKVNKKICEDEMEKKIVVVDDVETKMEYEEEEGNKMASENVKENKIVVDDLEIKNMVSEMLNKMKVEDLDEEKENKVFNVKMEIKILDYETENKMINNEVELNKMMNNVDLEMKMIEEEMQNKIMQYVVEMMDRELQNNLMIEELLIDQSDEN